MVGMIVCANSPFLSTQPAPLHDPLQLLARILLIGANYIITSEDAGAVGASNRLHLSPNRDFQPASAAAAQLRQNVRHQFYRTNYTALERKTFFLYVLRHSAAQC